MGKKKHYLNVKLDDEEQRILEQLMSAFSENKSDAVRRCLRFTRVISILPLKQIIKPVMFEQISEDLGFCEKVTLVDIIRFIPTLEAELRELPEWIEQS